MTRVGLPPIMALVGDWQKSGEPVLALLQEAVATESVNPGLPGGNRGEHGMTDLVAAFCAGHGIETETVEVLPGRRNIIARIPGVDPRRTLLFECHMDTASVEVMTVPPFTPEIRDGNLYGRGSCDTKAGGAAMLTALARVADSGQPPPCTLLFAGVVDEEHAMGGSAHLAGFLRNVSAAVVAEPTDLVVIRAHKGVLRFEVNVSGTAAHSAKPHLGANAIDASVLALVALRERLPVEFARVPEGITGPPTYNVGIIEGGRQVNFVPDQCRFQIDRRMVPGESIEDAWGGFARVFDEVFASLPGISWSAQRLMEVPPVETAADAPLVRSAVAAAAAVLGQGQVGAVPFGTDASQLARVGIPCIVLGPGSIDQAHAAVEWVDCKQVQQAVEIYHHLIHDFGRA